MRRIRIKKDITCVWRVTTNGQATALAGRDLSLLLVDPKFKKTTLTFTTSGNALNFRVGHDLQTFTGIYRLELWENLGTTQQTVVDRLSAFELVNNTTQESDGTADDIAAATADLGTASLAVGVKGDTGATGAQGERGADGSDANVTEENIILALGYTPADNAELGDLQTELAGKADASALTAKADKSYVDTQDALKADKTALDAITETKTISTLSPNVMDLTQCVRGYIKYNNGQAVDSSTTEARYTDFMPITSDGLWIKGARTTGTYGGLAFYDADKNYISGTRSGLTNAGCYIEYREGAAYVRATISLNDGDSPCYAVPNSEEHTYVRYGAGESVAYKVIKADVNLPKVQSATALAGSPCITRTADTLNNDYINGGTFPYRIKVSGIVSVQAKVTAFDTIDVGLGSNASANGQYVRISNTGMRVRGTNNRGESVVYSDSVAHGLTISDFIKVSVVFDDTRVMVILNTLNGIFQHEFVGTDGEFYGSPFIKASENTTLTNVIMRVTNPRLVRPIWAMGASYTSYYQQRWTYQLRELGITSMLVDGVAGKNSQEQYDEFKRLIALATPKILYWGLGMNDTAAMYKKYYNLVAPMCDILGITLILQLTPIPESTTSAAEKRAINEFVLSTGRRYVDMRGAASATNDYPWRDGYCEDGVHPTILGAKAMVAQLLADIPEILEFNKQDNIADKVADLLAELGDVSTLTTTAKTSAVAAINEVDAAVEEISAELTDLQTSNRGLICADVSRVFKPVVYNASTGFYECGTLTDITEEEAKVSLLCSSVSSFYQSTARFAHPVISNILYRNGYVSAINTSSLCINAKNLEEFAFYGKTGYESACVRFIAMTFSFWNCSKLKKISGIQIDSSVSNSNYFALGCSMLEVCHIVNIPCSISFQDSPNLLAESVAYMINNVNTSKTGIVLTLHTTAYDRAMADASVNAALAAHTNITIARV